MRIRPLLSRSRSRRRRARASHRRSRRSRRHRRRHHRSGISHTITPFAHRRSLSRNHPPRPSSTVARIVISHHESKMTMRGGANETRVRSRLRVPLSRARRRSIDRSRLDASVRVAPVAHSRPRSYATIPSHHMQFIHHAGAPSRPRHHRSPRRPRARAIPHTYTNTNPSIKQKKQSPHAQQKIKTKNRTGGTIPARASASRPRARAASTRRSIARESSSRARETSTRPRDSRASLECDAFGRSVGRRVRWTRGTEDAREWMHGARERRARCERARDGSRGAKGSRRGNGRRNAIEERARDAFVDRSGTIRGGRRLDGMKSNE